jgi:hypothetical protein
MLVTHGASPDGRLLGDSWLLWIDSEPGLADQAPPASARPTTPPHPPAPACSLARGLLSTLPAYLRAALLVGAPVLRSTFLPRAGRVEVRTGLQARLPQGLHDRGGAGAGANGLRRAHRGAAAARIESRCDHGAWMAQRSDCAARCAICSEEARSEEARSEQARSEQARSEQARSE